MLTSSIKHVIWPKTVKSGNSQLIIFIERQEKPSMHVYIIECFVDGEKVLRLKILVKLKVLV